MSITNLYHSLSRSKALVARQQSFVARRSRAFENYPEPETAADGTDMDVNEIADTPLNHLATTKSEASYCPLNPAQDASTAHFSLAEFHSRDGEQVPVNVRGNVQALMNELEVLRAEVNQPITVLSGYRSEAHNRRVGGEAQSRHRCGQAADIRVSGMNAQDLLDTIERLIAAGRMRDGGVGFYPSSNFVHYDLHRARRWREKPRSSGQSRQRSVLPTHTARYFSKGSRYAHVVTYESEMSRLDQLSPEPRNMGCWIFSATMMHSWRNQASYPTSAVAEFATARSAAGNDYTSLASRNGGLTSAMVPDFGAAMGWTSLNYSPNGEALFSVLSQHGPLCFFHNPNGQRGPGAHVMVIIGMKSNDFNDVQNTLVEVFNPWNGVHEFITLAEYGSRYVFAPSVDGYLFHY